MIIPALLLQDEGSTAVDSSRVQALLGWDGSNLSDLKPDLEYSFKNGFPLMTDDYEAIFLVVGECSYWKEAAKLVIAFCGVPLTKVKGLKKLGVSERGGFVGLYQALSKMGYKCQRPGFLHSDPSSGRYRASEDGLLVGEVIPVYRILPVDESEEGPPMSSELLRISAQVQVLRAWVGYGSPSLSDDRYVRDKAAKIMGVSRARLDALSSLVAHCSWCSDALDEVLSPGFLSRASRYTESEEAPVYRNMRSVARAAKTVESEGLLLKDAAKSYYSPTYQSLYSILKFPDRYWQEGLRNTEGLALDVDWKSRRKVERERKTLVKDARACTLRQFKAEVMRVDCFYTMHLLAGNSLDEQMPTLLSGLEGFSDKVTTHHGGLKLDQALRIIQVASAKCSEPVRLHALEALKKFADSRYEKVDEFCSEVKATTWIRRTSAAEAIFELVIMLERAGYINRKVSLLLAHISQEFTPQEVAQLSYDHLAVALDIR